MSALVASDVSYTVLGRGGRVDDSASRLNDIKVVFGDGAKTYPAGGVSLANLSKFGFPNVIDSLLIQEASSADGYVYKYDKVNNKLRIYQAGGFTPAGTVASHTHSIPAGTDGSGGTSGATAPAFTGTAVVAAALSEVSTSFVPASSVTLYVTVRGH